MIKKILFLVIIFYWIGLLPIVKGANDFPYTSELFLKEGFRLPAVWSQVTSPFGQNVLSTRWSWPLGYILGLGASLGISYGLLIVLVGIIPVSIIGSIGVYQYSRLFVKSFQAICLAVLIYMVNSYILLIIDGGQLLWAFAYALFPWCLFSFEKKIQVGNSLSTTFMIIPFILISFTDFRILYLLFVLIFARLCYQLIWISRLETKLLLYEFLKFIVLLSIFILLLHAFWIIPLVFSKSQIVPENLVVSLSLDFLSFTSLGHALFFQQSHWYKNIFGEVSRLNPFFIGIPILTFSIFLFKKLPKEVGFFLLMALTGIFLVKATQPPLGFLFNFMFNYIPGFFLFRDSSKFFIYIAFAYSILVAIGFEKISQIKFKILKIKLVDLLFSLVIVYFLILYSPVITNQLTGWLGVSSDYSKYQSLARLSANLPSGRMLWVSSKSALGYSDLNHLSISAIDLIGLRPFATGTKGTYETINFLREASYSGELLKISGVKYLVYPPLDPKKEYKKDEIAYHELFYKQLLERNWTQKENKESGIPFLELENPEALFFIPSQTYLVVGSDHIYGESTMSAQNSLSHNALVFLDEKAGLLNLVPKSLRNFLLYKTDQSDLLISLTNPDKLIFPAKLLNKEPNQTGWWQRDKNDFLTFKDFLIQKYGIVNQDFDLGGGWAIAEGEKTLKIDVQAKKDDILFIRTLQSSRSGELQVAQDGNIIGNLNLKQTGDRFKWQQVGKFQENSPTLTLKTKGDITIVNSLISLSPEEYRFYKNILSDINKQNIAHNLNGNIPATRPELTFKKLNEDQYKIIVKGLKNPSTIVFAQSYDPKWELDGSASFPVYSIFNGFLLTKDGEYLVEYSSHKYLYIPELISFGSLLILIGSVVYRYHENKHK